MLVPSQTIASSPARTDFIDKVDEQLRALEGAARKEIRSDGAIDLREMSAAIRTGSQIKAKLRQTPQPSDTLVGEVVIWRMQAERLINAPTSCRKHQSRVNLAGFLLVTVLLAVWVIFLHQPAVPALAGPPPVSLNGGIGPIVQSVFPRVLLFAMLGTALHLVAVMRATDPGNVLHHQMVSMVCAPVIALLISFYHSAVRLRDATSVAGIKAAKTFFEALLPSSTGEANTQAGKIATASASALTEVESALRKILGIEEILLYFVAVAAAFSLPLLLQGIRWMAGLRLTSLRTPTPTPPGSA